MASTHLFPRALIEDNFTWGVNSNESFSTRSANSLTLKDSVGVPNKKWQAIQRLKVPELVRVFMLLLVWGLTKQPVQTVSWGSFIRTSRI